MHVVQVNFFPAPPACEPDALFLHWPSLAPTPEAVAATGIRVSVIQSAGHDVVMSRAGVDYHFVDLRRLRTSRGRAARVAGLIRGMQADIVHVHSLGFARSAAWLRRGLDGQPIVLQDHADRPPVRMLRWAWRRWYAAADAWVFTSQALAHPFQAARLIHPRSRVFAIPESTSTFMPGERAPARAATALHGDPCVVSVGHLSAGKGVLTVIEGVAQAAGRLPGLHLWLVYGTAPLHADVQRVINDDPRLRGRVHLLGSVPHDRIETLLCAADLFVSGSLAESTGYAALEAIACGVYPVLTDIPAFRALCAEGAMGRLWPAGDARALATALIDAADGRPAREAIREHFDDWLSPAALGRRWSQAYFQLLGTAPAARA